MTRNPKALAAGKVATFAMAFAMLSHATSAQAQDQAQPATQEEDASNAVDAVITVTAQFREQNLQDTPLAITAVNAALLDARSQTNITDLGQFAPNVNLTQSTALNANSISAYIRGIGQDDASFALEPGVGIYVDDVYYGTTFGASFDLVDLDRVEILRGPQGTLAGKNSLGGAVKLFSRRPNGDNDGSLEVGYGAFDRVLARGSVGFTLVDGLYGRLSGSYDRRDGFFKLLDYGCVNPTGGIAPSITSSDCVTGTQGGLDVLSVRGALRYAPTGSPLEINISGDYARNDSEQPPTKLTFANLGAVAPALSLQGVRSYVAGNPFAGVPFDSRFITSPESYTSYENYSGSGNYTTLFGIPAQVAPGTFPDAPQNLAESWGTVGTIDLKLTDNLSLKSITAYRQAEGTSVLEVDGSPTTLLKQRLANSHEQFTQELRLSGQFGSFADFTVGGFYYNANDRGLFRIMIPTFQYDFIADDRSDNQSLAAFANLELHLTEALNVIGGVRYTEDKKVYTFSRTNADGTVISGIPFTTNWLVFGLSGLSGTFKDDRVDYRLGANYRFSDGLMVYGQVSTGFKGGGVNPRPFVPDQVVPFGPESVTTYEGGFKADFFGRFLRLNGALFYNEYSDIQRTLYVCPTSASISCSQPTNSGDGHSQGFELETFVRPVDGLTIDGSLGYLDFKYDSIDPLTLITLNMEAPFASEWNASLGAQYEASLGNAGTLTPRLDWTYQSDYYYQAVNVAQNLIPGRSLFNARLTYKTADRNWEVSGSVTNLFDEFYYVGASENVSSFGNSVGVVGRPREWLVSVRRHF